MRLETEAKTTVIETLIERLREAEESGRKVTRIVLTQDEGRELFQHPWMADVPENLQRQYLEGRVFRLLGIDTVIENV